MTLPGRKAVHYAVLAAASAVVVGVYALFDPAHTPFPRCLFLTATGLKCPGCGSQRAIHAILSGDIAQAWHYNAFMVASLPLIALLLVAQTLRKSRPEFYNRLNSKAIILTILVAIILWWIIRNIFDL